ncbi:MAG: cell division protein SepF [DPANN group archaeon]|nr:cell division protein SepF [DPANN group archaeon]
MVWDAFKKKIESVMSSESKVELGEEYVELEAELKDQKAKVLIRPFTLNTYDDIKQILAAIREGHTISILNIAPLKEKDVSELKRAIDKLKKTIEANEGDIAGFGENWLIATPSFAKVWRQETAAPAPQPINDDLED